MSVWKPDEKLLEIRQKYSAVRRIFNSLLGVWSGDETQRLMLDLLLEITFSMLTLSAGSVISRKSSASFARF